MLVVTIWPARIETAGRRPMTLSGVDTMPWALVGSIGISADDDVRGLDDLGAPGSAAAATTTRDLLQARPGRPAAGRC
jgi:hypothetical protein